MFRATLVVCLLLSSLSAQTTAGSLSGTITDPSGASVPGALVQLRGNGPEQRVYADQEGRYTFPVLRPGKYQVRVIAKGFTVNQQKDVAVSGAGTLDVQLVIRGEAQVINVEDEANAVNTEAGSNGSALVLREKELAALSDDPDELEQQLQAMAGPSTGPNGGQIYIDGFTGGRLPAKSSIREIRVNSNPYSSEYDRPGFGRIEILTKPGTDKIRGQAFFQFNDQYLNSRSPILTQSTRPPYEQKFFGFNVSGPIVKQKASFTFDLERRAIDENALILATTLDSGFNTQSINQSVLTPQTRTTFSPRVDFALTPLNTLSIRYQNARSAQENEGVGDFGLLSKAYNQTDSENVLQVTETAVLNAKAINETRFQYMRSNLSRIGDNSLPAISVQGAFDGGGAQVGNSGTISNRFELTNITTYTRNTHVFKWGARIRHSAIDDTSVNNFGGTYIFFGGTGPALDANNQPIAGTSLDFTALERYRRTLLFQAQGLSAAAIRQLGGGASQFTLSAGQPTSTVGQWDAGIFLNDDWRIRQNLTLSYGLRYETQTNIGDRANIAPRVGLAWGIGKQGQPVKTVLRAGFGTFFDRISDTQTLQARRFNGLTQQSYFLINPDTFPVIPPLTSLSASQQPQRLQVLDTGIDSPRNYQASVGVERQVNKYAKVTVQYVHSRGNHLQRTRNINAPINGVYPFGDAQLRILTESSGLSTTNQMIVSPNINYKKLFLFGFYSLSYGKSNAEGNPADPYNLSAEWGPSSFADVRHRFLVGTSIPLPLKFSLSPFLFTAGGTPYNVTIGRDLNGDGFTSERPSLVTGIDAAACRGGTLTYAAGFGCFNLNPAPGTSIGRNLGRGPNNVNLNLRLGRSWAFGKKGESGPADGSGMPPGIGGLRGPEGGGRGPGGPGGGGPPGGGGRGPGGPGGMFGGSNSGKKYNLSLSISARNVINRANYAPPSGDLSSPFFGVSRSLAGFGPFGATSTYNRKIDLQLRLTF